MYKRDPVAAAADPGRVVDERYVVACEVVEGSFDVGDGERNVVQALPSFVEESPDRRIAPQRLKELEIRATDCDHCFFDSLGLHDFAGGRLNAVLPVQIGKGRIEVVHGDGHMIDVVRQHALRLPVADRLGRDGRRMPFVLLDEIDVEAELSADGESILVPEVPAHRP